jgi:hypothetical protein
MVPLIMGALIAKGHGDKIVQDGSGGKGASNTDRIRISTRWVRWFCRNVLNLRYKRPTRTTKHDHDEGLLKSTKRLFLLRLTYLVYIFTIPKELVVNMDETGVLLLPLRPRGWAPAGKNTQTVFHGAGPGFV